MNYRDYFKKEETSAQLKDEPKLSNVDPSELEMGIKHEMEHTTDERTARIIAAQHLKDDAHYYTKLGKAGMDECGMEDTESGLPKLGGALAIPHLGQPIHMSKIIQVGSSLGGPATGALSGMTSAEGKGVTVDKGGVKVSGDKEPITAGGHKLDASITTKSVGGPVVAGEGEKQGGPNTKGTYANTAKMDGSPTTSQTPKGEDIDIELQEGQKKNLRKVVKEVLKEITFNKETGKWIRINEAHDEDVRRNAGQSEGGYKPNVFETEHPEGTFGVPGGEPDDVRTHGGDPVGDKFDTNEEVNMKTGPSYKGPAGRQYRTSDDDWARKVEYEPEITEMYDEEEESSLQEQYFNLLTKQSLFKESEMSIMKQIKERLDYIKENKDKWMKKALDPAHKGYCTPMTKSTCTPARKAFAQRAKKGEFAENTVDMKTGPAYKVIQPRMYQTSEDDWARTNQYNPEITEAGGAEVQTKSYRTANDAPQIVKNRHKGDIDEADQKKSVNEISLQNTAIDRMVGDEQPQLDPGGFVSDGLKKLFQSGKSVITIDDIDKVGMSHIKDVDKAIKYAVEQAWDIAPNYGYEYDERNNRFVKKTGDRGMPLGETAKKSTVTKTIQKGAKAKTATEKQKLVYKAPKKTKSGVVKKRN
jgi:hypothetical protein